MNPLGEYLKREGEILNNKASELNRLSETLKKEVEDLEGYVDNIKGIEINVGGDFTHSGVIEGNKILANINGKIEFLEGRIDTSFKADITAGKIELIGASISSSQVELKGKEISIVANEKRDREGYIRELVSSNLTGGSIKINSEGDIYISSSNIMGNSIGMEAGSDIIVTGQAIENKLSEEELGQEKIIYTDINTKEVVEGSIEEAKSKGRLEASGYREESVGSNIVASESLILEGNNIGVYGSTIYSEGLLALEARDTLEIGVIENLTNIDYSLEQRKVEKHGAWHSKSKTITTIRDEGSVGYTNNVGSNIIGGSIYLGSGEGMDIVASSIGNVEKEEGESSSDKNTVGDTSSQSPSNDGSPNSEASPTSSVNPVDTTSGEKGAEVISEEISSSPTTSSKDSTTPISSVPPAWEGISSGDIIINSGGDLSIRGAEDKRNYELSTDIQIKEISTGFSTIADNAKNLGKALENYGKSFKDGLQSRGGLLNHMKSGVELANATTNLGNILSFNVNGTITNTESNYNSQQTTYMGSQIVGDNITINSGKDTNIKGSEILAKDDVKIETGGDLNISSGENTFNSKKTYTSSTNAISGSIGIGISPSGVGITASVSYGYSNTKGDNYSTAKTYTDSIIGSGNNVSLSANKDINLIGSNVYGTNVNTSSDNLNIESLQNEYKSWGNSNSYGVSIGISGGGKVGDGVNNSLNAGLKYGNSSYDNYNLVTNNVVGISANNNLNIKTNNSVNLKGSTLEAQNKLDIESKTLNTEDIKDISTLHSQNYSLSYIHSFSEGGNNKLQNNIGIIGVLNTGINVLNEVNKYTPNIALDIKRSLSKNADVVKSGINKVEGINVDNININQITGGDISTTIYEYSNDLKDIYTDTTNGRINIYNKEKSYDYHIAPSEWIDSSLRYTNKVKKALNKINDYDFRLDNIFIKDFHFDNLIITDEEFNEKNNPMYLNKDTVKGYSFEYEFLNFEIGKANHLNQNEYDKYIVKYKK